VRCPFEPVGARTDVGWTLCVIQNTPLYNFIEEIYYWAETFCAPNLSTFRLLCNPILSVIYISCHPLTYASVYNCVLFRISGESFVRLFFSRSLRCLSHQPEQPHFIIIFWNGYNLWSSRTHFFSLCLLPILITQYFLAKV